MTAMKATGLDVVIEYESNVLNGPIDALELVLRQHAIDWSRDLRAFLHGRPATPVDLGVRGDLRRVVAKVGGERGPLFAAIQSPGAASEQFGSVELRGASKSLVLPVSFDEQPWRRAGGTSYRGNAIVFQLRDRKIAGEDATNWARVVFREMVDATQPTYARAGAVAEFQAKNVVSDAQGTRAVGVDIARSLPGLYWLNYFGPRYGQVFGADRIHNVDAPVVEPVGDGVIVGLDEDPLRWNSEVYVETERRVESHLGPLAFHSRAEPNRKTIGLTPPGSSRGDRD
jgi:hypothetical protein